MFPARRTPKILLVPRHVRENFSENARYVQNAIALRTRWELTRPSTLAPLQVSPGKHGHNRREPVIQRTTTITTSESARRCIQCYQPGQADVGASTETRAHRTTKGHRLLTCAQRDRWAPPCRRLDGGGRYLATKRAARRSRNTRVSQSDATFVETRAS